MHDKKFYFQLLLMSLTSMSAPTVYADAVDDAMRICKVMEATGDSTGCEVKGYGSTVDVTMDTNGAEAKKICLGVADFMAEQTRSFGGEWKLRIFSPYSGEKPIAICTLR